MVVEVKGFRPGDGNGLKGGIHFPLPTAPETQGKGGVRYDENGDGGGEHAARQRGARAVAAVSSRMKC